MPSRYREELSVRAAGQLIITLDPMEPCLSIYPLDEWTVIEQRVSQLPSTLEEARRLQRVLFGNAVDLELDANGRFLVPPRLRTKAGLDKRVMLVGRLNKFQLWDEDAWEALCDDDLASLKQPGGIPDELRGLTL